MARKQEEEGRRPHASLIFNFILILVFEFLGCFHGYMQITEASVQGLCPLQTPPSRKRQDSQPDGDGMWPDKMQKTQT